MPFALRAFVGAQGNTFSYEIRGEPLSAHRATRFSYEIRFRWLILAQLLARQRVGS